MAKKHYRIAYGGAKKGFGRIEGFMNVLAKNKRSAQQQVRRKTRKPVYNR